MNLAWMMLIAQDNDTPLLLLYFAFHCHLSVTRMSDAPGLHSLILLGVIFAVLLYVTSGYSFETSLILNRFFAVLWCLLSTCLGTDISHFFSGLWKSMITSARVDSRGRYQRAPDRDGEYWEMDHRSRPR